VVRMGGEDFAVDVDDVDSPRPLGAEIVAQHARGGDVTEAAVSVEHEDALAVARCIRRREFSGG